MSCAADFECPAVPFGEAAVTRTTCDGRVLYVAVELECFHESLQQVWWQLGYNLAFSLILRKPHTDTAACSLVVVNYWSTREQSDISNSAPWINHDRPHATTGGQERGTQLRNIFIFRLKCFSVWCKKQSVADHGLIQVLYVVCYSRVLFFFPIL